MIYLSTFEIQGSESEIFDILPRSYPDRKENRSQFRIEYSAWDKLDQNKGKILQGILMSALNFIMLIKLKKNSPIDRDSPSFSKKFLALKSF